MALFEKKNQEKEFLQQQLFQAKKITLNYKKIPTVFYGRNLFSYMLFQFSTAALYLSYHFRH